MRQGGRRAGEHILVAEKAFGGPLPDGVVIHHVNGDGLDNRPENLVICENQKYHVLLHQRERALKESGNANWLKCVYCKNYDDQSRLYVKKDRRQGHHRNCEAKYKRDRRHAGA